MDFCTLGMLIIDEIRYLPPTPPSYNVLGGAGTYAAVGARLFRPSPSSSKVGWTIHRGYDFPEQVQNDIKSWQTGVQWIETPERQTTRALNEYVADKGGDYRAFRYTSEKIRLEETHLNDAMVSSKSFHMICSPERCIKLVEGIRSKREQIGCHEQPIIVWEPVPDLCLPGVLESIRQTAQYVDIISPNLAELSALFDENAMDEEQFDRMEERCLAILKGSFEDRSGAVIVRCGSKGCYIRSKTESRMLPAYWQSSEVGKVVDPTGGGNQFLGGLCIGLQSAEPKDLTVIERGAIYGNIAASFAVEQVGLPVLSCNEAGQELWNGESVENRMAGYIARLS